MHISNSILSTLGLDTSEFFFNSVKTLYDEDEEIGKVTFDNGHYHLTVGNLLTPRKCNDR